MVSGPTFADTRGHQQIPLRYLRQVLPQPGILCRSSEFCSPAHHWQGYLVTHMKACSGIKEEECAYCGKKFSKRTVLQNHERLHTGERPYHCRICDERFRTHHTYSNHGRNAHGALNAQDFTLMQDRATINA